MSSKENEKLLKLAQKWLEDSRGEYTHSIRRRICASELIGVVCEMIDDESRKPQKELLTRIRDKIEAESQILNQFQKGGKND